jgi:hypothetical protein
MNRYVNGKIYEIVCTSDEKYIGSTISTLPVRFSSHKSEFKRWKEGKIGNVTVFEIFNKYGIDNCTIKLIEEFPCNSKKELERREGEIIRLSKNSVNKLVAGRSQEEYHQANLEKRRIANKQWRDNNPEKDKARWTNYYIENSDKKREYAKIHGKEYREKNREKERLRAIAYRESKKIILVS